MNFIKYITDFLESLKGFSGRRFYIVLGCVFIYALCIIFKDPISEAIISSSIKFEFRECRNEQGLKTALDKIIKEDRLATSYAVYLYQPKDKAVYKTCVLTDNQSLQMSPSLKYIYLKDQVSLNTALRSSGYVIIQQGNPSFNTDILTDFNIDSLLIYKIEGESGIIGELIFSLQRPPSAYELDILLRKIGPLCRNYIL